MTDDNRTSLGVAVNQSPPLPVRGLREAVEELNAALDKFWNTGGETSDGQIKQICAAQKKCKAALAALPADEREIPTRK